MCPCSHLCSGFSHEAHECEASLYEETVVCFELRRRGGAQDDGAALRSKDTTKGADPVVIGKFLMACVVLVVSTVMVHVVIALALGVSGIGVSVTTTNVAGRSGIVKQITLTPSANNVQVAKALSKEQATPKEADIVVRNMDVGTSIDTVVRTIVALADTVL